MLTLRDHQSGDLFDPWEYLSLQRSSFPCRRREPTVSSNRKDHPCGGFSPPRLLDGITLGAHEGVTNGT